MRNKQFIYILCAVGIILLIPFTAMQFTDEVHWSLFDFLLMALLLLGTGLLIEFAIRKLKTSGQRIVACLLIVFIFLLVWAELAVGVFGTPLAGS